MLKAHARQLEFASMMLMLLGIAALCQPWVLPLHEYSVLIIIIGGRDLIARIAEASDSGNACADLGGGLQRHGNRLGAVRDDLVPCDIKRSHQQRAGTGALQRTE